MHFSGRFIIVLLLGILLLTGCAEATDLFDYTGGAARFDAVFPSVSGDTETVICACIREETGDILLTVTSPLRLKGFFARIRTGHVVCGTEDMQISLSDEAARGLTELFAVLSEEGTPRKSPDGTHTIITSPFGTVTLDENLNPAEISAGGRSVKISGWIKENRDTGSYET